MCCVPLQVQLVDASGRATRFDSLYGAVSDLVLREEAVQASQAPIHSEVEAVKLQMEQHKVLSVRLISNSSLYRKHLMNMHLPYYLHSASHGHACIMLLNACTMFYIYIS